MSNSVYKKNKFILWLIIIFCISIFLSGRIEFWLPEYAHADMIKYREMASAAPALNLSIIQPYVFRILAPWLAGISPFKTEIDFYVLNFLSLLLMVLTFYRLLIIFGVKERTAFVLTFALIFNRYFFQFLAWDYFHLSDSLSYALLFLSIIMLTKEKWIALAALSFVGVLTREIALLIIPVGYAFLFEKKSELNKYIRFSVSIAPTILIFVLVRILIKPVGGDNLLTKFLEEGGAHFFTIDAIAKKFFISFTPFGLVPLIFYKEIFEFMKSNLVLTVLFCSVLFTTLFGLDHERLMTPAVPAYFTFVGFVIDKYSTESPNRKRERDFFIIMMVLSFLSSFYHLWGIVKLPSAAYTLTATLILIGATGFHFLRLKTTGLKDKKMPS